MTIKTKILGGFIVMTVVTVLIIMFTLPELMVEKLERIQKNQLNRTVKHIINLIDKDNQKISNYIKLIGKDQSMVDATYLGARAGDIFEVRKEAIRIFKSFGVKTLNIYKGDGSFLVNGDPGKFKKKIKDIKLQELKQYKKSISDDVLFGLAIDDNIFSIKGLSQINFEDDLIGIVEIGITLDNEYLNNIAQLNDANVSLAFGKKIVASNLEEMQGASIKDELVNVKKKKFLEEVIKKEIYNTVYAPLKNFQNKIIGTLIVSISKKDVILAEQETKRTIYSVTFIILIISIISSLIIVKAISGPISKVIMAAKAVADGDLTYNIDVKSQDEMGQMAGELNRMLSSLKLAFNRVQERTDDLERSETRIRAILDNIGEGIVTIFENGGIESINPAAEKILSINKDDVVGGQSVFLLKNKNANPFQMDIMDEPIEYKGERLNGSSFYMELIITKLVLGDDHIRICIVRDITKRKETEDQLIDTQQQLLSAAHKSGMADMATGVLHNIGNILNSVQVSSEEIDRVLKGSKIPGLLKANKLLNDHIDEIGSFFTSDKKGKMLPQYYIKLGSVISDEFKTMKNENISLKEKIIMMKDVISTQQAYARTGSNAEDIVIVKLIEDAINIQKIKIKKYEIELQEDYYEGLKCFAQKSKLLQVVTNLIKNASEAMLENDLLNKEKIIRIKTGIYNQTHVYIKIKDNGIGVSKENLTKIFSHGFTTKKTGHGFGLHTSANSMTEMKGKLTVISEGINHGTEFIITIPISKTSKKNVLIVKHKENIYE